MVALVMLLTLASFAFEVARIGQCRTQMRAVSEQAATAGVRALRRTGDTASASSAIDAVVARHVVCDATPSVGQVTWGSWTDAGGFSAHTTPPHAVEVVLEPGGSGQISTIWGGFLSEDRFNATATSIASTQPLHLSLVYDAQTLWSETGALAARDALRAALDRFATTAGPDDTISLIVAASRYAWTWTPQTPVAGNLAALDASWQQVILASRAGAQASPDDGIDSTVHTGLQTDDYTAPAGGCYPAMPRRYSDEVSVDLGNAIQAATAQLSPGPSAAGLRGVVLLTPQPYGNLPGTVGDARTADGYAETRFPERVGSVPVDGATLQANTFAAAQQAAQQDGAHVWIIPYNLVEPGYDDLPQGMGWRYDAPTTADLGPALLEIIEKMPVGVTP